MQLEGGACIAQSPIEAGLALRPSAETPAGADPEKLVAPDHAGDAVDNVPRRRRQRQGVRPAVLRPLGGQRPGALVSIQLRVAHSSNLLPSAPRED